MTASTSTSSPAPAEAVAKLLPARRQTRSDTQDKLLGQDTREVLFRKLGTDLTDIEGIGINTSLIILTEIGTDVSRFPTEKHFTSWLGLCPDNRISVGKVLSSHTRRVINRVSDALRIAAMLLERSQSALGAFHRRIKARLGAAEAVTATAHKLARLVYRLLKYGEAYVQQGIEGHEKKFQERKLSGLKKAAAAMGFQLIELQTVAAPVS